MGLKLETTRQRMLAILCAKFPKCFFPIGETPKPLKINIFGAIYASFEPKTVTLKNDLKIFLTWYVRRKAYLKAVVAKGAIRVGLNGEQAGIVTEIQRAFSQEQLYQKLQSEADIKAHKKLAQIGATRRATVSVPSANICTRNTRICFNI